MTIKTKSMMVRESTAPYINTSNALVGTCNPLKQFFCIRGISGNTVTDPIGSVVKTGTATAIAASGNGFLIDTGANALYTSGTAPAIGTADCLIVISGQAKATTATANAIRYTVGGSTSNVNVNNTTAGGSSVIHDGTAGTTVTALSALTADTDYSLFTAFDRSANANARRYTTAAAAASTATSAITGSALAINAIDAGTLRGFIYGAGFFVFSGGLPANWEGWSIWMAEQWKAGNYVFPPAWVNL